MGSGTAGILGFISGFAGSKADEAVRLDRDARNEALRLRKEESALLKERRILKIRGDFKSSENTRILTEDGMLNSDGTVNTEGLEPELARQANPSNIRQIMKEQRSINEKRRVQGEKTSTVSPGSTVLTEAEKIRRLEAGGGSFTTPDRPPTRSEIKTNFNLAKQDARAAIRSGVGNFTPAHRTLLGDSNLTDISRTGEDSNNAYMAMIASIATTGTIAKADDTIIRDASAFETITSTQLINTIKTEADVIDQAFKGLTTAMQEQMQVKMDSNTKSTARQLAAQLIKQPMADMKKADRWHPSMEPIWMNTLTGIKATPIEESGFFDRFK